jgi:hypothetical protein
MRSGWKTLFAVALLVTSCAGDKQRPGRGELPCQTAKDLTQVVKTVRFAHDKAALNLSDAAVLGDGQLALVSDEGTELAIVDPKAERAQTLDLLAFARAAGLPELAGVPEEIDLEALATSGDRLIVVGSASLKRKKPKQGKPGNAERIGEIGPASGAGNAHSDFAFVLRDQGADKQPRYALARAFNLRTLLLSLPILAPFGAIPSKDNGLDVEGAALLGSQLFFGLRGPVLRGHAVVVRSDESGAGAEPFFLDLDGLGVRALSPAQKGGMFILAGPTMELHGPFVLYRWDGQHSVFVGEESAALKRLGALAPADDLKPEGLFTWQNRLCWVGDGRVGGGVCCTAAPVD